MKRKLLMTLKSLSALLVSVALVLSSAGPASAEVGYMPEKCTGAKYVCSNWSSPSQPSDGSWKFEGCYESNVSFKFQVKKGKKWKTVKGASGKGKTDSRCSAPTHPYLVSVSVNEKSKGTKTYRFVVTEKKKKPYYANFKVEVSKYVLIANPTPSPSLTPTPKVSATPKFRDTPEFSKYTYDYISNWNKQLKSTISPINGNFDALCHLDFISFDGQFRTLASRYEEGSLSEASALSQTDNLIRRMANSRCWDYR
jgi:hypothetical protein